MSNQIYWRMLLWESLKRKPTSHIYCCVFSSMWFTESDTIYLCLFPKVKMTTKGKYYELIKEMRQSWQHHWKLSGKNTSELVHKVATNNEISVFEASTRILRCMFYCNIFLNLNIIFVGLTSSMFSLPPVNRIL